MRHEDTSSEGPGPAVPTGRAPERYPPRVRGRLPGWRDRGTVEGGRAGAGVGGCSSVHVRVQGCSHSSAMASPTSSFSIEAPPTGPSHSPASCVGQSPSWSARVWSSPHCATLCRDGTKHIIPSQSQTSLTTTVEIVQSVVNTLSHLNFLRGSIPFPGKSRSISMAETTPTPSTPSL